MKKTRIAIIVVILLVLIGISTGFIIHLLDDNNKLSSEERTWINDNINNIQNVNVLKDENLFSKDGEGVFYTFLNDFSAEYGVKINIITYGTKEEVEGNKLGITKDNNVNNNVFYKDNYVIVSKTKELFSSNYDLDNKSIGVLNEELDYIKSYLKDINISYIGYDNMDDLYNSLNGSVKYIIVSRMQNIDRILNDNLEIVYHLNDINNYYVLNVDNETFGSILKKYFLQWEENINKSLKEEEFKLFKDSLNIKDTDIDKLLSVDYKYGFINNSPYEVIMNKNYGGIVAEYLKEFSDFSGVYFNINKYRNIDKLINAINRDKVDIYFGYSGLINTNYLETSNGINNAISIVTRNDNDKVIDSIYGLEGETVYVENNSNIYNYLKEFSNIKIETYKDLKELFSFNKKDVIIVMDTYTFDYYQNNKLSNYVSKYNTFINDIYKFKINPKYTVLHKLFNKYINYLDSKTIISHGINSHNEIISKGNVLNSIAKYIILIIIGLILVGFIVYKKSKRIRIARRLRKDDKIRFIDDLTSLKNRAYLSNSMKSWNNNTIYPQTIIVVDLNNLKEINDKYGVEEGDKQIQGLANILISTQLDNSDIMRSDGNEFVIYAVGYNQKQIINYIHKLGKELKKLPYDFGAEFGYSIIDSNLKTVEDALNEATIDMKSKKNK